jgi:hypothetical protein
MAGAGGAAPQPGGVFVAVGYGGRRVRSLDDGQTWVDDASLEPMGGDDMALLRTVAHGDPGFVALGWRSMTSPDGQAWNDHGANIGQWIGAVTFATGQFVAVGGYGLRAVSNDGVTWQNHSIDTVATHPGDGLVFGDVLGGRFVSANDQGKRSVSSDGTTWAYAAGADATATTHLAFGNGLFLGVGGTDVVTSPDGQTWASAAPLPQAASAIVFGGDHFTVIAPGHVFTSKDGGSWDDHPVDGLDADAIAYGHGAYVLVRGSARRRSADGIAWDAPVDDGGNPFTWVTYGPLPAP